MSSKEYVIWGKAPNSTTEDLLVCEKAGINNQAWADRVVNSLETEHGCKDCRVQVLDLSTPFTWNARSMVNA
jgi:hypothetical protein